MMQTRTYQSASFHESSEILNREWSKHTVAVSSKDPFRMRFSIRPISQHMSISHLAYGVQARVQPQARADVFLLQMPLSGAGIVSYNWGNTQIDSRHYGLIDVRDVTQVHCSAELDVMALRIDRSRLQAFLERTLGRKPHKALEFAPSIELGTPAWQAWAPVNAALAALLASPLVTFPEATLDALEQMVLATLLMAQPNNFSCELQQHGRAIAPRHVKRAEAYIYANLALPINTDDMARHAGVSVRALFDGFRQFRSTTPAAYLRDARLAGAHAELLRGTHSVAEVAARCGFRHAGHFASQYKARYGQLPAQTCRLNSELH